MLTRISDIGSTIWHHRDFPKELWNLSFYLPKALGKRLGLHAETSAFRFLGFLLYLVLGFPVTLTLALPFVFIVLFLFFELVIQINAKVVGQPAVYHFEVELNDLSKGLNVELPGYQATEYDEPNPSNRTAYYNFLLEKYSPTIIHHIGYRPKWDIPVRIDFDGNQDPRDNVRQMEKLNSLTPYLHGEVIAETEDSYYLAYMLYHIKDYDQPLREFLTHWTFHDNDNEGLQLRVSKKSMQVEHVETWFHNRFFLCNRDGLTYGSEPIQALSLFEGDSHIVIYAQSLGHGVRCATRADLENIYVNNKIMRLQALGQEASILTPDRSFENDISYQLTGLAYWYEQATNTSRAGEKANNLFEEKIIMGSKPDGSMLYVGRFISGLDYDRNAWSRPKPPWSWDDKWDEIPITTWHFDPSFAFQSHAEQDLSQNYIYNMPAEIIFGMSAETLRSLQSYGTNDLFSDKWSDLDWRSDLVGQDELWLTLKAYVNYLFMALG